MSKYGLSNQDLSDAAADYRQVYPFTDIDTDIQQHFLTLAVDFESMKSLYEQNDWPCLYADSLIVVLHILLNKYFTGNVSYSFFMDVMGMQSMACVIASIYSIPKCLSIELSDDTKSNMMQAWNYCKGLNSNRKGYEIACKTGSMQNYFDDEANIAFLSTLEVVKSNPLVDEAQIIALTLRLCKRLQPGSFIITITKIIDPSMFMGKQEDDYTFNHLKVLYHDTKESTEQLSERHIVNLLQVQPKGRK